MRDADGTKPPYGSYEYWIRFMAVYGTQRSDLPTVRPDTEVRARVREAVARFKREYPHLTPTGRDNRHAKLPPGAGPGHM
ncbi:hypothetical protein [Streptomyces canus]|uniref:hypothetical protein n=1 Tax=Streptomyces canus TaxID=58343 RepID=UPI00386D3687|nr:hypothetical protein OH824_35055 [Streptomyces canus]